MSRIPLLLLPGLLCDEVLWRDQVQALADIGEAVIADLTQDDSVAGMAARALSIAPPRFALAGLSMGGYVAFEILRQAPERVMRLALLDTSAAPDDARRVAKRRAAIASLAHGRFSGVTHRLLPQLIHPSKVHTAVGDTVRAMAERVGGDAFLRQQYAILGRPDSRPLLAQIQVPTLVAVGDGDGLTPLADAMEIHAGIAASRLHVFKDCGHLPALELPAETSAVMRQWLRE